MTIIRNYKFRLYPNSVIVTRLNATLDASRWLYNYLLSKNLCSKEEMQFALTELKETEPWLKLYHSKMLQMIPHRIDTARRSLMAKRKKGYGVGKLQYATENEWDSFEYNQSGFRIERHGATDLLWMSKIGWAEIRLHRPVDGKIKQITITKGAKKWHAVIAVELQPPLPKHVDLKKSVGIDVGIKNYAYDSDGFVTPNPLNLQKMLKPLTRAQRKIMRRQKESNNRKKAVYFYQIIHERIRNKRKAFLHQLSTQYAKKYDLVFVERLAKLNMVKNHKLARNILDSGWGIFTNMLDYKTMLVEVPAKNTTIDCSRCGHAVPKSLAVRTHMCSVCGLTMDRDHNAAINILKKGLDIFGITHQESNIQQPIEAAILPQELREITPVEISRRSWKQEESLSTWIGSSPGLNICLDS